MTLVAVSNEEHLTCRNLFKNQASVVILDNLERVSRIVVFML